MVEHNQLMFMYLHLLLVELRLEVVLDIWVQVVVMV
jgi:hypothetical protein